MRAVLKIFVILIVLLLTAVCSAAIRYHIGPFRRRPQSSTPYVPPPPPPIPDGFTRYTNTPYHFTLAYPSTLTAKQFNEGKGASTVIFTDGTQSDGFEVFVTPYQDTQITSSRVALDTHNTGTNITQSKVNGVDALVFSSRDQAGQTLHEVWFLYGHYLYEFSSYFDPASFSQIISTLHFE